MEKVGKHQSGHCKVESRRQVALCN